MQKQPNIELSKNRDFGELITDTFAFLKQNFKPLLVMFFTFNGLFLLAMVVLNILQYTNASSLQQDMMESRPVFTQSRFANFGLLSVVAGLVAFLNYTLISTTVLSYMALYREKGNQPPSTSEVWGYIKYYFMRLLGSSFLLGILLVIGFVFCVIPGVYLYPIFGLVLPIIVMENASFGYAFNRSFKLINDNWWTVFGALFVIGIIMYTGFMVFSLPVIIITVINFFTHHSATTATSLPLYIINIFLQTAGQMVVIVPVVTSVLCYFKLVEIKESTGLLNRINTFGTGHNHDDLPAEEY